MEQPDAVELLCHERVDGGWMLWPIGRPRPAEAWFAPGTLPEGTNRHSAGSGRGDALRFEVGGTTLVLRHYRRGGMVRWLGDRYLRLGLRRSRAWRELFLLTRLRALALPVPEPVGARVQPVHRGSPFEREALLTRYLPATRTLAQALEAGTLARDAWPALGALLARFHRHGVDHADLNAHNILIAADQALFLIDFDRGRLRRRRGRWCRRNLERLRRSLDKLAAQRPDLDFAEADWSALEAAYRDPLSAGPSTASSAST